MSRPEEPRKALTPGLIKAFSEEYRRTGTVAERREWITNNRDTVCSIVTFPQRNPNLCSPYQCSGMHSMQVQKHTLRTKSGNSVLRILQRSKDQWEMLSKCGRKTVSSNCNIEHQQRII
ncbi:uncharacterized protein C8R40DRAFT_1100680 [Lentinula edodes]|uniref:uncharacterized protein n=1 Tax=Lentinula edodes TaxID=5353 RepID=UPI001E8E5D88|nr:uncharacterized protein C8R40DRAFT_1100680 [Lentinula edodes]KAH7876077.1 hypothetical protein C8R40DRAFT_1100680 [Lentinula edodes]